MPAGPQADYILLPVECECELGLDAFQDRGMRLPPQGGKPGKESWFYRSIHGQRHRGGRP